MNSTEISRVIDRILTLRFEELESSDTILFVNTASFLSHSWRITAFFPKGDLTNNIYFANMFRIYQTLSI